MDSESSIRPIAVDDWSGSLEQVIEDMGGHPINIHRLLANHPALLNAWWPLRNHTVSGGALGDRLVELLILRVSLHLGSWYEWSSHVVRALEAGISEQEIRRVAQRDLDDEFDDRESALLLTIDELMLRQKLTPEMRSVLESRFSREQVLDILVTCGVYRLLGMLLATWDVPLDGTVREDIPEALAEPFFRDAAFNQM